MIQALRGMKDFLPPENKKYVYFIENASRIAKNYGFEFIETPILEESALFRRSVGESSDIVGKEMYEFVDKGENRVCMRPEGTAGVVRSVIENKLDRAGGINRFFYYGPMFRYERPQKGRLRQFHQFGVESFGSGDFGEDLNIILMIKDILDFFEITFEIRLNSLGCGQCMPQYKETLVKFLDDISDGLCEDCHRRKGTNPIRTLDCKNENCQNLLQKSPKIAQNLCNECDENFGNLLKSLDTLGIEYKLDPNLVRGLDYYSRTAFEFVGVGLGAQNAIAGGGRYDKLVEHLGGRPTPAVGFAIGIERVLGLIEEPQSSRDGIYFGIMTQEAYGISLKEVQRLRKGEKVFFDPSPKSLKAHLKNADKLNVKICMVIGESELEDGVIWVKDLEGKIEQKIKTGGF